MKARPYPSPCSIRPFRPADRCLHSLPAVRQAGIRRDTGKRYLPTSPVPDNFVLATASRSIPHASSPARFQQRTGLNRQAGDGMKKPEVPGRGETPPGKSFSSGIRSRAARRLPEKEILRIKRNKYRFSYRYPKTVPRAGERCRRTRVPVAAPAPMPPRGSGIPGRACIGQQTGHRPRIRRFGIRKPCPRPERDAPAKVPVAAPAPVPPRDSGIPGRACIGQQTGHRPRFGQARP